jgi:branched-subunit amino acid transport protein
MKLWTLIASMAVVTYLARALHLLVPEERVPAWVRRNLDLIPIVILAAMIAPAMLAPPGSPPGGSLTYLLGAGATVAVLRATGRAGLAVVAGLALHVALRLFVLA